MIEEIGKALRKMKTGKSTGWNKWGDVEIRGGECVEWLARLFIFCWVMRKVPQDWQDTCVVPLDKGKGDKFV